MKINRQILLFTLITCLTIVEMGFLTFWRKNFDPHHLPIYYFLIQIIIALLPIIYVKKQENPLQPKEKNKYIKIVLYGLIGVGVWLSCDILLNQYKAIAINPKYSDIIPQIQMFCKTFLNGQYPYKPFDDFGYRMTPTYLPAQWLPYLPAEMGHFDPRFITLFIFCLTYIYLGLSTIKKSVNTVFSLVLMAIPVILVSAVNDHDQGIWSVTVEMGVMCYYLIVGLSLAHKNYNLLIISIVACLMSRFSLIFWLPLLCFVLWTEKGTPFIIKFMARIALGCAILYLPFLIVDYKIFNNAQVYYDSATVGEWTREDRPVHIYNGLGFAIYFLEKGKDIVLNIALLKKTMIFSSVILSMILGIIWWYFKDKLDKTIFIICSLKLSLTVFYSLIQIPYSYLYVTPFIISLIILYNLSLPINATRRS